LLHYEGCTIEHGSAQFSFGSERHFGTICIQNGVGDTYTVAPDLRQMLTNCALKRAGIQAREWEPENGFAANRENVRRVYDYYGDLYQQAPHKLLWAGLARLGGLEVFYPGFLLLDATRRVAAGEIVPWLSQIPWVRQLLDDMLPEAAILAALECHLLQIQKSIFEDLAWQHEAYLHGRLDWLWRCYQADLLQQSDFEAWSKIHQEDDPEAIGDGNKVLVWREQERIVQPIYDMLDQELLLARWYFADRAFLHPLCAMSALAMAMHGHMESFHEVMPEGNIMNLTDRWQWIEEDVYPCWLRLHQMNFAVIGSRLRYPLPDTVAQVLLSRLYIFVREWLDSLGQR
jgi:hypothetical protein